jgi:hypothetical protein
MFHLQPLLGSFSASKCSLVHDKVYALLGIVTDATDSEYPILPDYDKPLSALFLDVLQNQRSEERDATGKTWNLIESLCSLLELDHEELVEIAFHEASKIKREIYALMFGTRIMTSFDWYGRIELENLSPIELEENVMPTLRLVGCEAVLEEYLDFCPPATPYIPSNGASIEAFVMGLREANMTTPTKKVSLWNDAHTSDITQRLFRLDQQRCYTKWWGSFGFTHKSARERHKGELIFYSYHSFGRFGTALVMSYEEDSDESSDEDTSKSSENTGRLEIVGIAFMYKG